MALHQPSPTAVRWGDPWAAMADVIVFLVGVIFNPQDTLGGPALQPGRLKDSVGQHDDVVVQFVCGDAPHMKANVVILARE